MITKEFLREKGEPIKEKPIVRGEVSNHSHYIIGGEVYKYEGETYVIVEDENEAAIKHLLETEYTNGGNEVWTGEHKDISLSSGVYKVIVENELDPYTDIINKVRD